MPFEILGPAESGEFISEKATFVTIHEDGLDKLSTEILSSIKENGLQIPDTGADSIHPSKSHPKAIDWVFITDALNFCFWSLSKEDQWTVNGYTGYYALEAALYRAIKDGIDIVNPKYYSQISEEQLQEIFKGDTDAKIPLFEKRLEIMHEVGKVLLEKYNGTFESCLKNANKSAVALLDIIVKNFPSFRDEAMYCGVRVSLYKRAQILIADLWNFLGGEGWVQFYDIDKLTMFADYRVPQVLVYFGAMSYSNDLMEKLRNDVLLDSCSQEEVEIRGCSIHAVELLKQKLAQKLKDSNQKSQVPNSSLIDYYLWCYRRENAKEMETVPYHKTLGIFY